MYQNYNDEQKKHLNDLADLINGFTKTGMEILTDKIESSAILKGDLAPFLLFRQILEMGDALGVLLEVGCINSSKPIVRTLLECYFQLAYMLNNDEDRKALQFLFHYEIRQKEYYAKLAFPERGGSFYEKLKNDKHLKGEGISEEQKIIYAENVRKIDNILNNDTNKEIILEYERTEKKKANLRTGKKGKVSYWYELFDGPTSIEGISIVLDEAALYQFIYRSCSSYSHGEDIVHANLESYDDYSLKIAFLRDLRQVHLVSNNILLLLEKACMLFVTKKMTDKRELVLKLLPLMNQKKILVEKNNDLKKTKRAN